MGLVFFRRPKPRPFNYKPMYYDQEKDELEERKRELGLIEDGDPQARLRAEIRRKWSRKGGEKDTSNMVVRSIIYLFIFVLSVYLLFFTDFMKNILAIFTSN